MFHQFPFRLKLQAFNFQWFSMRANSDKLTALITQLKERKLILDYGHFALLSQLVN